MAATLVFLYFLLLLPAPYGGNHHKHHGCRLASAESLQQQQLKFDLPLRFTTKDVVEFDAQRASDTTNPTVPDFSHGISAFNLTYTPDRTADYEVDSSLQNNVGRLKYNVPLIFPFGALPSFNTSFTFRIENPAIESLGGDGIAFALTNDEQPPLNSSGRFLGLTTQNTNDQQDHTFFALEFDTYQNTETEDQQVGFDDPSNSHIGINVNSLNSTAVLDTDSTNSPLYLYRNYCIKAWLEYDASQVSVRVWATNVTLNLSDLVDRPSTPPILEARNLNLSQKIRTTQLYAVITAASGYYAESHSLFAWSFQSAPQSRSVSSSHGRRLPFILLAVVSALLVLETAAISCTLIIQRYLRHRHRHSSDQEPNPAPDAAAGQWLEPPGYRYALWRRDYKSIQKCDYEDFRAACNNFSYDNILGEGGCGVVFFGILSDGMQVAVKKMKQVVLRKDFFREIDILKGLDHPNLLPLLAWCSAVAQQKPKVPTEADGVQDPNGSGDYMVSDRALDLSSQGSVRPRQSQHPSSSDRSTDQDEEVAAVDMLLVYPFISNGSLERYIGSWDMAVRKQLGKERRLEILCQVSEALAYLHSQNCVHRDVKTSNVLLTERLDAMVGDFGLARMGWPDRTKVVVTVMAAGTPGYMAPELVPEAGRSRSRTAMEDEFQQFEEWSSRSWEQQAVTYKADVYSFGVLALRVASGRLYSHAHIPRLGSAIQRSANLYDHREFVALLDPALEMEAAEMESVELKQWRCVFLLGMRCISRSPAERPEMGKVSQALRAIRLNHFPDILDTLLLLL